MVINCYFKWSAECNKSNKLISNYPFDTVDHMNDFNIFGVRKHFPNKLYDNRW